MSITSTSYSSSQLERYTLFYDYKERPSTQLYKAISQNELIGDKVNGTLAKAWATMKSFFCWGQLVICPDFTLYVTRKSVKCFATDLSRAELSGIVKRQQWFALTLSIPKEPKKSAN